MVLTVSAWWQRFELLRNPYLRVITALSLATIMLWESEAFSLPQLPHQSFLEKKVGAGNPLFTGQISNRTEATQLSPLTKLPGGLSLGSFLLHSTHGKKSLKRLEPWLIHHLHLDPTSLLIHYQLCNYYLKMSDLADDHDIWWHNHQNTYLHKATHMAYQISLLDPDDFFAHLAAAQVALHVAELDLMTLEQVQDSFAAHPSFAEWYYLKAKVISHFPFSQTDASKTIVALSKHPSLPPEIYASIIFPILSTLPLKEGLQWIAYRKSLLKPQAASAWEPMLSYLKGRLQYDHGFVKLSRQNLATAFAGKWHTSDLLLTYAETLFKTRPSRALAVLNIYRKSALDHSDHKNHIHYLWLKGLSHFYLGQYTASSQHLSEYLQRLMIIHPESASKKLTAIGAIYENEQANDELISLYTHLIYHLPQLTKTHELLGDVYLGKNLTHKAQKHFADAVVLDPLNQRLHSQIGKSYELSGDLELALAAYEKAYDLSQIKEASQLFKIACIQALLGKKDLAIQSLHQAITDNPRLKVPASQNASLASLKSHPRFMMMIGP